MIVRKIYTSAKTLLNYDNLRVKPCDLTEFFSPPNISFNEHYSLTIVFGAAYSIETLGLAEPV